MGVRHFLRAMSIQSIFVITQLARPTLATVSFLAFSRLRKGEGRREGREGDGREVVCMWGVGGRRRREGGRGGRRVGARRGEGPRGGARRWEAPISRFFVPSPAPILFFSLWGSVNFGGVSEGRGFEGPGASNTTKIPREDLQRERQKERK